MRYLITGSSGLLGQEIIKYLSKTSSQIRCLVHQNNLQFNNKKIELVHGNITNKKSIELICKNVDIIIHCAAVINAKDNHEYINVNYEGTRILVDLAQEYNVKKFVYVSSWAINPLGGYYSLSKLLSEQAVKKFPDYLIIRPSDIFSKNESHLLNYIRTVNKLPFIPVIGNGEYLVSPLFVTDLVKAIFSLRIIKKSIVTVTGPHIYTFNQFNKIIFNHFNSKKAVIHIPEFFFAFLVNQERLRRLTAKKNVLNRYNFTKSSIPLTFSGALRRGLFD